MADSTRSSSSRKRRVGVVDPPDIIISPKRTRSDEPDSPRSSLSRTAGASGASGSARARARGGGERRTHVDHSAWGVEDVVLHLVDGGIARKVAKSFREHRIRGKHLLHISREDLERMGVSAVGDQKDVLSLLGKLSKSLGQGHVFNDPIHGHVELHPLLMRIIDTPQFQRLRYIKQLGGGYYVFPGASHNRFEHSIGVCHLAGELVETLQRKQPELSISPQDVLCVKIAGLCHDLGHGPFSHLFDSQFIKRVRPDTRWKHEDGSVRMFEHLLESNDLKPELLNWGLDETDLTLIKEQIAGPLESQLCSQKTSDWPYCGRTNAKSFLYEIVANKRNGVDVDKWDYFARDCHCLGIPNNFDTMRYMKFARVIDVNNRKQICTRDKEVGNLYEMFHTRSTLHRRAYQHKTSKIIEIMITEALEKANEHFFLLGSNGKEVRLSESIDDMVAYTRLTDQVFQQILLSTDPNLKESREILEKIERRQLYKCVGQTQPSTPSKKLSKDSIAKLVISSLSPEDLKADELPELTVEDIVVDVVSFDYGMGDQNPIDHVRFYTKDKPNVAVKVRKDQVSQMLPQKFKEENVRVYCKSLDKKSLKSAWKYFITWCRQQDCITPKCAGGGEADQSSDLSFGEEREEETHFTTPYGTPYGSTHKADNGGRPISGGEVVKKLFPQ